MAPSFPAPASDGSRARPGFTLIELLLVLAILVVLAGMAWPALDRLMTSQRLARAAEQVRARWNAARASAIESGRILAFRYEPAGAHCRLDLHDDLLEAPDSALERLPPAVARLPSHHTLPDGVWFAVSEEDDLTDALIDQLAADESGEELDLSFSEPILFFPDGTCSGAQLSLADEHGWSVKIQLRGLTGVVTVGRPERSEEPLP